MTTNVIDAIREKEADAHAEREEAFAERNRLNQAFFDGKLIAYAEVLRLLRSKDLRLGRLHAAIAFTIVFSELVSWLLFLGLSVLEGFF